MSDTGKVAKAIMSMCETHRKSWTRLRMSW